MSLAHANCLHQKKIITVRGGKLKGYLEKKRDSDV